MAFTVRISGDIGRDYGGVTEDHVVDQLGDREGPVTVRINSGGGDVFEGFAIYNTLRSYNANRGPVSAVINSLAGSIAGVIALAADRRSMTQRSRFMMHEPFAAMAGTIEQMKSRLSEFEHLRDDILDIYQQRLSMSRDKAVELMRAETWLSGDAAVKAGVAHELVDEMTAAACISPRVKAMYRDAPDFPIGSEIEAIRKEFEEQARRIDATA